MGKRFEVRPASARAMLAPDTEVLRQWPRQEQQGNDRAQQRDREHGLELASGLVRRIRIHLAVRHVLREVTTGDLGSQVIVRMRRSRFGRSRMVMVRMLVMHMQSQPPGQDQKGAQDKNQRQEKGLHAFMLARSVQKANDGTLTVSSAGRARSARENLVTGARSAPILPPSIP